MSTRPAHPPPVARWPYFLGDLLLLAVAILALVVGGSPPGFGTLALVMLCVLAGIALSLVPFLLDYEARLRFAEAASAEFLELQVRRLSQAAEHLANALARGQSTEEQAGRALATLEEMAEKFVSQAEEAAQALAKSDGRERAALEARIESLQSERAGELAAMRAQLSALAAALADTQGSARKNVVAVARSLEELGARFDGLAARIAALDETVGSAMARLPRPESAAAAVDPAAPAPAEPAPSLAALAEPEPAGTGEEQPAVAAPATEDVTPAEPAGSAGGLDEPADAEPPAAAPASGEPSAEEAVPAEHASKTRVRSPAGEARASEPKPARAPKPPAGPEPLELGLEGLPEPRRRARRDGAVTTSVVATAYIGIGNKLFLRGEGPGLSWHEGVPMQFLAIGKWGWSTTEASEAISCRIYRNDEAPMLDADFVVPAGGRAEVTPRF